ncbi:hypothetical protein GCM10023322_45180 [Rugosimonospora acidiphila]|uniref:Restriction endonuclease domain-containing protein n=1 Tax=Rugosimonospora acidiphila TaxID=556531 RepID=A0ABP9S463_9ACTN
MTARPGPGQAPYRSAQLLDDGTKPIEDLPARCDTDQRGHRYLEVEAGTVNLGPTYRLYAAREEADELRGAADDLPVERLVLVPEIVMGLYDDYDDDLGVPWAYPLRPLRWARPSG